MQDYIDAKDDLQKLLNKYHEELNDCGVAFSIEEAIDGIQEIIAFKSENEDDGNELSDIEEHGIFNKDILGVK